MVSCSAEIASTVDWIDATGIDGSKTYTLGPRSGSPAAWCAAGTAGATVVGRCGGGGEGRKAADGERQGQNGSDQTKTTNVHGQNIGDV